MIKTQHGFYLQVVLKYRMVLEVILRLITQEEAEEAVGALLLELVVPVVAVVGMARLSKLLQLKIIYLKQKIKLMIIS